jgi:CheY-like chemotaxis protein
MYTENRPLIILQIEDTPSDAVLTALALKEVVPDGKQALLFLQHGDGFTGAPRPDLILLDLSLPGLNGQDVLRVIKNDPALKAIPVVIFTTLDTDESQLLAYTNCANSYVVKPLDFVRFTTIVQSIAAYWSQTSSLLPRRSAY